VRERAPIGTECHERRADQLESMTPLSSMGKSKWQVLA
jgi:hypothetical protein